MIRTERETLGLSMRDLAALAGVSYPTISRIENGHEDPRWDTLTKLAAALGKTLADWTKRTVALESRWEAPATPRRRAMHAENTPAQFAARGITLPKRAIWRDRELIPG